MFWANFGLYVASVVPFVQDALVVVAASALLYLAFRDRSRALALVGAFGMLAGTVASMVHEVGAVTLAFLAGDFLEKGGPGTIAAGNPIILESARMVSVVQGLAALLAQTALGLGVLSFGILLAWAPAGERNPLGGWAPWGSLAEWDCSAHGSFCSITMRAAASS